MNELVLIPIAFVVGITLGVVFFGGLWFTVKSTINAKFPALWLLGSIVLRFGITLLGFYYVCEGNWQRLVACVLGFILARFVVLYVTKRHEANQLKKEVHHEA